MSEISKFETTIDFDASAGTATVVIRNPDEWQAALRWQLSGGGLAFKYQKPIPQQNEVRATFADGHRQVLTGFDRCR